MPGSARLQSAVDLATTPNPCAEIEEKERLPESAHACIQVILEVIIQWKPWASMRVNKH